MVLSSWKKELFYFLKKALLESDGRKLCGTEQESWEMGGEAERDPQELPGRGGSAVEVPGLLSAGGSASRRPAEGWGLPTAERAGAAPGRLLQRVRAGA